MELHHAKRGAQVVDTVLATARLFQDARPTGGVQASKPIRQVLERIELLAVLDENFTASANASVRLVHQLIRYPIRIL